MADLLTAEVMDILKDKYLFNNIPTKFSDFDNGTLINIYLRMITVVDDANDISHLDSHFNRTQELTHESRLFFLEHIIRCIRSLECSYWAPKTLSLLDKKRALRILTSLYEEGVKRHGKGLPQRIRAVIKKEEIRNKNLKKKTSKVNGATYNGCQIPRTPLKLDPIERNIKERELMPPPPEFCSPPIGVELAATCLSPPTEISDVEGSCLPILPIFSHPEEKFSPDKIFKNCDYDKTEIHQRLSDVAPLRFMDDENNQPVTYFHGDGLKGRETYDVVPNPLKSRETFVVSQPMKSRGTFVVSQPLKKEENSICVNDTENEQHQSQKNEKKGQNANENCILVTEKLIHGRSPLQVINARARLSRRCKTKASEAISKALNDS